jgi:hypothetical protein
MKDAIIWDVTPCGYVRTDVSNEYIASIIRVVNLWKSSVRGTCLFYKSLSAFKEIIIFTIKISERCAPLKTRQFFPIKLAVQSTA